MVNNFVRERLEWVRIVPKPTLTNAPGSNPAAIAATNRDLNLDAELGSQPASARSVWMSLKTAIEVVGLPHLPGTTPDEEFVELLKCAAEVEHGLMVQYLYAMYSAKNPQLQGKLRRIAVEEMGHLITVQNLLKSAGQSPHWDRYDVEGGSPFQPFPFRLEPVSKRSIAKYAACEMPEPGGPNISSTQQALIPEILSEAQTSASLEPFRVGLLYAKLYWLLRSNDGPLADPTQEPWVDFPISTIAADPHHANRHVSAGLITDTTNSQARPDQWQGNHTNVIVDRVASRADGLLAVANISAQGEGFGGTPDGHFDQFIDCYVLAKSLSDSEIAYAAPTDPWHDAIPPGTSASAITSLDGRKFARLGDVLYALTVQASALALTSDVTDASRTAVAQTAFMVIMRGLRMVGSLIVSIERDAVQPAPPLLVSNLCFARPPQTAELLADLLAQIEDAIQTGASIADDIAATTNVLKRRTTARGIAALLRNEAKPIFDTIPR